MNTETNEHEAPELAPEVQPEVSETEGSASAEELSTEQKLELQLAQEKDKFLRLFAEFENYKKRTAKERLELFKTANQEVLVAMLPVLDDFDRAQKSIQTTEGFEAVKTGIDLVHNKLKNILHQKGLKEMETDQKIFDSEFHEAITKIPAPSEDLKGKIIDTLEKGYFLNDKVIRFAKVVVGE